MIRLPLLAVILATSACSVGFHNRPTLRWTGQLTATANATQCRNTRATLVLRENNVMFAPDDGTWVIEGKAGPNTLEASRSRMTSDHKIYATELKAQWTEQTVQGTYTTPLCSYAVNLARY